MMYFLPERAPVMRVGKTIFTDSKACACRCCAIAEEDEENPGEVFVM
jgi:hypothetical protein